MTEEQDAPNVSETPTDVAPIAQSRRLSRKVLVAGSAAGALLIAGAAWAIVSASSGSAPSASSATGSSPLPSSGVSPGIAVSLPPEWASDGAVTVAEGLPTAEPLTLAVLESAQPGWVLATDSPEKSEGEVQITLLAQVLYLLSPTGERYQVLDLGVERQIEVLGWRAGETFATVRAGAPRDPWGTAGWDAGLYDLDLRTGALRASALAFSVDAGSISAGKWGVPSPELRAAGIGIGDGYLDPSGRYYITTIETSFQASGDEGDFEGSRGTGYEFFDLTTGTSTKITHGADVDCRFISWLDASNLMFLCNDAYGYGAMSDWELTLLDLHPRLVSVPRGFGVDASTPPLRLLVGDDPVPSRNSGAFVAPGVVAFEGTMSAVNDKFRGSDSCPTGAYLFGGGEFSRLDASGPGGGDSIFDVRAFGGRVYVGRTGGCSGDGSPVTLSVYDSGTGMTTMLFPRWVEGSADWLVQGLTSWVIGY